MESEESVQREKNHRWWIGGIGAIVVLLLAGIWWHRSSEREFETAISENLPAALEERAASDEISEAIARYYEAGQHHPLWFGGDEPSDSAARLLAALDELHLDGLDPVDYASEELRSRVERFDGGPEAAASLELRLTRTFLAVARDLRHGRISPGEMGGVTALWLTSRQPPDGWERVLAEAADDDPQAVLARQRPSHRQYSSLQEELERYRTIVEDGGWPEVPGGPVLERGDRSSPARMRALAERLAADGFLDDAAVERAGAVYGDELAAALRRFQSTRTLEQDGKLGGKTLEELNVAAADRVEQIELNLERWRWVPEPVAQESIWVNIPTYRLYVVRGDEIRHAMKVVVGTEAQATPVFSDQMEYVVVNPEWNVPESITREEIVPELRENPEYLASRNMVAVPIEGEGAGEDREDRTYSTGEILAAVEEEGDLPFRIKQLPGRGNALGRIKFMFPNEHSIYLHDTPEQHLMDEADRVFSHGCIRLEEPFELADIVLEGTSDWDGERVRDVVGGEQTTITLDREIPVHIVYFTAIVGEDGRLFFGEDIYGVDRAHARALDSGDDSSAASQRN